MGYLVAYGLQFGNGAYKDILPLEDRFECVGPIVRTYNNRLQLSEVEIVQLVVRDKLRPLNLAFEPD